jgi:outer membrane protein OmpA-like peptidoglycan-associated protein
MSRYFVLLFFLNLLSYFSVGQLRVDTNVLIPDMVRKILIGNADQFKIKNIKYTGARESIGVFHNEMKYHSHIKKGIIISTGNVTDANGPNEIPDKTSLTFINEDTDLEKLAHGKTFDAAVLEFDFSTEGDSISFNFFFASEEYPEYVNKNLNDVFGFLVTDLVTNEKVNLAVLPGTQTPITVDNVNGRKNSQYFINNVLWHSIESGPWPGKKETMELSQTYQFDGMTTLIHAVMPTKRGTNYRIKMAIADVGDRNYDSAIFLEAKSFTSHSSAAAESSLDAVRKVFSAEGKETDKLSVNLKIKFETDSSRVKDKESILLLNKVYQLMKTNTSLHLQILGHTDETGTATHNLELSEARAKNVADYLKRKGIEQSRITFKGLGSSKPLDQKDKSANRRVEFVFRDSSSQ